MIFLLRGCLKGFRRRKAEGRGQKAEGRGKREEGKGEAKSSPQN
jgi:hypothetical protein